MKVQIEVLSHASGKSLYINGFRVAGNKPFGGGKTTDQWFVDADLLVKSGGLRLTGEQGAKK